MTGMEGALGMTGKERALAALRGELHGRLPVKPPL